MPNSGNLTGTPLTEIPAVNARVYINSNYYPFAEVLSLQKTQGVTPSEATIRFALVQHDDSPTTLNRYEINSTSGTPESQMPTFGSRVVLFVYDIPIFSGHLMRRKDSSRDDSIIWTAVDDRDILSAVPVRGALVWDEVTKNVKFLPSFSARTNPKGFWNCTYAELTIKQRKYSTTTNAVETERVTVQVPVFMPYAKHVMVYESPNANYTGTGVEGTYCAWTPRRWMQYLCAIANLAPSIDTDPEILEGVERDRLRPGHIQVCSQENRGAGMSRVSVLVPSRNEPYLAHTVDGLFSTAGGDIEVIVVQDGPPYTPLHERQNLTVLCEPERGLKACLNQAATLATGDYFMKIDAHCSISKGWDILMQDCADNWVVIPRLYVLDADTWDWQDGRFYDHFYLPCPITDKRMFRFQAGGHWPQRTQERLAASPLDETMNFQGSCWFMTRKHYWDHLQGWVCNDFTGCAQEQTTIGLQTWLGPWDGRCMTNKSVWYAHMHKGRQHPRGYPASPQTINAGYLHDAEYWMAGTWEKLVRGVGWLVSRFAPVPTWPDNWREMYAAWLRKRETP